MSKIITVTPSPVAYEKMVEERDERIEELLTVLHALKENRYSGFVPMLERVIKERNSFELELELERTRFQLLLEDNEHCRKITKHLK